jgi:hypothetical protein
MYSGVSNIEHTTQIWHWVYLFEARLCTVRQCVLFILGAIIYISKQTNKQTNQPCRLPLGWKRGQIPPISDCHWHWRPDVCWRWSLLLCFCHLLVEWLSSLARSIVNRLDSLSLSLSLLVEVKPGQIPNIESCGLDQAAIATATILVVVNAHQDRAQ